MEINCQLLEINSPEICNERGGFRTGYWFETDKVDWEAMAADPLQFDATNQLILGYTMIGGATMSKLTFDRKNAFYDFTYTDEAETYALLITMFFKAKDNARRIALQHAISCCNVGFHLYANNGTQRVVAQDWNGLQFGELVDPLKVVRHLDAGGQLGSSKARDEVDLGGESLFAPLFANVDEANLPLV